MPPSATAPRAPARATRARALPPEERRAAIIEATLPLVLSEGPNLTTRQIADAAGIAEGTIFRVFPDKASLLQAVLDAALDPAPIEAAIDAIDRTLPVTDQLVQAVALLQKRVTEIWQLIANTGITPDHQPRPNWKDLGPDDTALGRLVGAQPGAFRFEPARTADRLRAVTVALSHPVINAGEAVPPEEIVAMFLHGMSAGTGDPPAPRTSSRKVR